MASVCRHSESILTNGHSGSLLFIVNTFFLGKLTARMIAVMTMNVGYFFAVIGGIFFGELVFGKTIAGGFSYAEHGGH